MQRHAKIAAAIRGGDSAAALVELEQLLASDPGDFELRGLKGLALALSGRVDEAVDCARLAVSHAASPAQRIKHAGNLARLLAGSGCKEELASLAEGDLPRPGSLQDGEIEPTSVENLCGAMLSAGHFGFVAEYLEPVLDRPWASWEMEKIWLAAAAGASQHEKILARYEQPSYRWQGRHEAIGMACAAADTLHREEPADRLYGAYFAVAPIHAAPRRASQIMSIVLISPNPRARDLGAGPSAQHFANNFPSQLANLRADRYRFLSVFEGSPPRAATAEIGGLVPAITLNNCVNGEILRGGQLARVQEHEQALGLPLINPAELALRCTRIETAESLRGIPNLVVPRAMRFRIKAGLLAALRKRIAELFRLPVILRTVGEQEGRNIHLASTMEELDATLAILLANGGSDFYAIDYAGVRHANGLYRRFRAAYVGDEPTIMRVDYDVQWMVKGRKYARIQAHYRNDPVLLTYADSYVRQPERIGEVAWVALREVGRRMPLDIFGIDFEVDHEGRVVFFEANATMNLLSNAPREFDYPREGQEEFLRHVDALFLARAGVSL